MPTKAQLEDQLNEMLDLDAEWSKMKKDDLEHLLELVESGALIEPMAKYHIKEHGKKAWDEKVDEWYPGKYAMKVL